MQTVESLRMGRMFSAFGGPPVEYRGVSLGSRFLRDHLDAASGGPFWTPTSLKPGGWHDREVMRMMLRTAEESEFASIGRGLHRPYKVVFLDGVESGGMTTRQAVMKTVYCQFENKRYCESVDINITGPEREILSYELDRELKFDLVPPTVGRHVSQLGYGSVQAWVSRPTAWEWQSKGYDYRQDQKNPWLHRLAAFDFIRGEIDRHANNWIMDRHRRVYAIDNGYAFVKGDQRKWFRTSAGKHLVGTKIHPDVQAEIQSIDEDAVYRILQGRGFKSGEEGGVLKRVRQLKGLDVWQRLGDLW
jgi:hypothetical protein